MNQIKLPNDGEILATKRGRYPDCGTPWLKTWVMFNDTVLMRRYQQGYELFYYSHSKGRGWHANRLVAFGRILERVEPMCTVVDISLMWSSEHDMGTVARYLQFADACVHVHNVMLESLE